MQTMNACEAVLDARRKKTAILAFNIPYLPMVQPVAEGIGDEKISAIIQVARVEWEKFSAKSPEDVAREYLKYEKPGFTLLGLDHVPVIDEDLKPVDYRQIILRAIDVGYQSVLLDGSRLDLEKNIVATVEVADIAHRAGIACEAELGAVLGHESGPMKPYEEIFQSRLGFTDLDEAKRFVEESRCDWLSVAAGSIHGAVAEATRHQKKPAAKLDIDHIVNLYRVTGIPLVLHGGSGIKSEYIRQAITAGIAKINIGTEIRKKKKKSIAEKPGNIAAAQEKVYLRVREIITEILG
jgi:fructose/tagatose bisphosphate aldolase